MDRNLRIIRVNQRLAEINGRSVDEHLGSTVAEMAPHVWPRVEDPYRRALDGEPTSNLDITAPSAEEPGRDRHWLASFFPVHADGQIFGVGNVVVDITDRVEEDEFRAVVLDNLAEGLLVLDSEGAVSYINRAASVMLGWTADELHGRPMHDTVHFQRADGTAVPAAESPLLKVRTEGRPVRILDDVFVRKNGSVLPVSYSSAPLQRGSTIRGVVVAFRDITEEKKARAGVEQELTTLTWIGRIRDALDEHRFVLYSQPLVPLTGGRPGQELLLRMVDRDGQVIAPGAFLPIAEKYGLISEIDRWVIAQAIEVAARTREVINVNVSAATLGATDLLPYIEGQLSQAGADPADLVIEITETALMHDSDAGEAFAHGLAAIGCGLALDDFGTGFGGFTYLKRLPVSHLKIDAEFTRDLLTNPSNRHVIQAIVSLSRAFGVRTTAEGVEDGETLEALRAEGVDFAQGYHLGRPTPVNRGERRRLRTADVVASGDIQLPLRTWISRPS